MEGERGGGRRWEWGRIERWTGNKGRLDVKKEGSGELEEDGGWRNERERQREVKVEAGKGNRR